MDNQQKEDLKRLISFLEEEVDCVGFTGEVPGETTRWLGRCIGYLKKSLKAKPVADPESGDFKGFDFSGSPARNGGRECTIRYVDKAAHTTCHLIDMRLISLPLDDLAVGEALHHYHVNSKNDDEGWITIASVGKLIKAGVPLATFDLTAADVNDIDDIDNYEVLLVATDMSDDSDTAFYLWIRA